jgi:hypothetical protein
LPHNIEEALQDADAVNVLRMQFERDEGGAFPNPLEYFQISWPGIVLQLVLIPLIIYLLQKSVFKKNEETI